MKTIVSDFDKTFYTDKYKENIELINKFVDEGNIFIIATGRNLSQLKKDLDSNIKFSYLICNDGAAIYDKNLSLIKKIDIDDDTSLRLYNDLCDNMIETYIDNGYELIDHYTKPANGVIGKIDNKGHAVNVLNYVLTNYDNIGGYKSTHWINLTNKEVNKANGIKILDNLYCLGDIYTVGDDINDLEMLHTYNGYKIKTDDYSISNVENSVVDFNEFINKVLANK